MIRVVTFVHILSYGGTKLLHEEILRIGSPGVDIEIVPLNFFMKDLFQQSQFSIKWQAYLDKKIDKRPILRIREIFDYRLVKLIIYQETENSLDSVLITQDNLTNRLRLLVGSYVLDQADQA